VKQSIRRALRRKRAGFRSRQRGHADGAESLALIGAPSTLGLPSWSWPSRRSAQAPGRRWPSLLQSRLGGDFGVDGFERFGCLGPDDLLYIRSKLACRHPSRRQRLGLTWLSGALIRAGSRHGRGQHSVGPGPKSSSAQTALARMAGSGSCSPSAGLNLSRS